MSGPELAPDGLSERLPGLAEREVERGALESPAAIVEVHVSLGRVLEERLLGEVLRERVDRPRACERKHRSALELRVVLGRFVGDVLAEPLLAASDEADGRRLAREAARNVEGADVEVVRLHLERQVLDGVVEAHRAANATDTSPANRALATASLRFTSRVRPPERS